MCLYVCLSVCLSNVPFSCNFLRGRTGAERVSSVDWCDLNLDLNLNLDLILDLNLNLDLNLE